MRLPTWLITTSSMLTFFNLTPTKASLKGESTRTETESHFRTASHVGRIHVPRALERLAVPASSETVPNFSLHYSGPRSCCKQRSPNSFVAVTVSVCLSGELLTARRREKTATTSTCRIGSSWKRGSGIRERPEVAVTAAFAFRVKLFTVLTQKGQRNSERTTTPGLISVFGQTINVE